MKKMINKYRFSKYKRIAEGLLFAFISAVALLMCLDSIFSQAESRISIIMMFCIAMISMLMGLSSLFHKEKAME